MSSFEKSTVELNKWLKGTDFKKVRKEVDRAFLGVLFDKDFDGYKYIDDNACSGVI